MSLMNHFKSSPQKVAANSIKIFKLNKYGDKEESIIELLKSGNTVVFNLENLSDEEAKDTLRYIRGAVKALNAEIASITDKIHVLAPNDTSFESIEE